MNNKISIIVVVAFFSSCTEDYSLHTLNHSRMLTIDGCITNEEGPYLIKITECFSYLVKDSFLKKEPVLNARVIITDDAGNRDELQPLWQSTVVSKQLLGSISYNPITQKHDSIFFTRYYLLLPHYNGSNDTLMLSDYSQNTDYYKGLYYTTSIKGAPGRTYTLTVECDDKTYTATDRMPKPATLDSVVMRTTGIDGAGKGGDGFYVPHLYFQEPQETEDYYLFTYSRFDSYVPTLPIPYRLKHLLHQSHGLKWQFEAVSDRFMASNMENYKLGDGATSYNFYAATDVGWEASRGYYDIYMVSISQSVYRYFQMLCKQFYQDGGSFSPAPNSPPTNISNGGQGVFKAVSVSTCRSNYFFLY